jgi:hypothetical protein
MDNITGFGSGGDEISLGLNFNSNASSVKSDWSALDQILQQMVKDQETFNGIQSDSFDKVKAIAQEVRNTSEQGQQLISIFRTLRGEQEGNLQNAKQLASTYQQINNELQKTQQTQTRMGITSPGASVPGSNAPSGGPGAIPGVPATQTGSAGGGGIKPPNTSPTAGFANEPDDFFGREEEKSGGGARRPSNRRPSDIDMGGLGFDPSDLDNIDLERDDTFGFGGSGKGARRTSKGVASNEHYKQISDLALSIFPGQGYYSRLRRARWLARNEGGTINKFISSKAGQKMGMALNRLGGGQRLRTNEGYQLFPFDQDENGNYVDSNSNVVPGQYGLQNAEGQWLLQGGPGVERPTWSWSGQGETPPMPNPESTPQQFNPWARPNLTSTGEGAAKIAGATYAARMLKAKGGDLFREGQLYTGITGGTGIRGALGYDIGAQETSWFGLNPLESYGQAKQITMQNLALGYRGNLLNQANSFGNQALQKYGVDPQTSMQMFGQMVMQAGASLSDLNDSLATLADTASKTDTSFSQLQQNVVQYSQIGANIGLTGSQNALFATSAAQFAAGQPTLGATGANPADILDSMVGQALVAQQMGTSYLGLPQAVSQQGAGSLLSSEIKVNQGLMNRIGLNQGNYQNKEALRNSYFKYQLLMKALGRNKEANQSFKAYSEDIGDLFSGKQQKEYKKTLASTFSQDVGQGAGETASEALAAAISPTSKPGGSGRGGAALITSSPSAVESEMQKLESQNKWQNIGVSLNGKFMSLSDIEKLPQGRREALEARIATGAQPLSSINQHGKLMKGNYSTGTLLDREGQATEQTSIYGKTSNSAAAQRVERNAMKIELGPNAKKFFTLLDDPSSFNRYLNNWAKTHGIPTTDWGNQRSGNN